MKTFDEAAMLELADEGSEGGASGAAAVSFLRALARKVSRIPDAVGGALFAAADALNREGGLPRFLA